MHAAPITWLVRLLWLTLPVTLGALVASSLAERSDAVRSTSTLLAWALWTVGLFASLVVHPRSLVAMRVLAPLSLVGGIVAAMGAEPDTLGLVGLATAASVSVAAATAEVGLDFVNGVAYGDERRFPLRPPAALLIGPMPAVWALTALPLPSAALLLAARQWVAGSSLAIVGAVACWWGAGVLYRLAQRWCVVVPAGLTLVDHLALTDPTLIRRADIARVRPAPADTDALDLTVGAPGLIVQIDLSSAGGFMPVARRGAVIEVVEATSVLVAPSRPGALIAHAADRSIGAARI